MITKPGIVPNSMRKGGGGFKKSFPCPHTFDDHKPKITVLKDECNQPISKKNTNFKGEHGLY